MVIVIGWALPVEGIKQAVLGAGNKSEYICEICFYMSILLTDEMCGIIYPIENYTFFCYGINFAENSG